MGVELVVAATKNGVIGRDGEIPWHLPADLKHFKDLTLDKTIIMGRKTAQSIKVPLSRRNCVVVSTHAFSFLQIHPNPRIFTSLHQALEATAEESQVIIGGEGVYKAAMPFISTIHLTEIDQDILGDRYFHYSNKWRLVERSRDFKENGLSFRFKRLVCR